MYEKNARHAGGRFFCVLNRVELSVIEAAIEFPSLYDFDRYNFSLARRFCSNLRAQKVEFSTKWAIWAVNMAEF
jgi:hypothetical protein